MLCSSPTTSVLVWIPPVASFGYDGNHQWLYFRGRTGTVQNEAAAPPHTPQTQTSVRGRCSLGATVVSLLPFSFPVHASWTNKISQGIVASAYPKRGDGSWTMGEAFGHRGQQWRETSWMHFANESIIKQPHFYWVIRTSVENRNRDNFTMFFLI